MGQRLSAGTGLTLGATLVMGGAAHAATFEVNTTADNAGSDPCDNTSTCSLRSAITDANAHAGSDKVVFQSTVSGTITLNSQLPPINQDLKIVGPGSSANLQVSGNNATRIFSVISGSTQITGLHLENGNAGQGGAIFLYDAAGDISLSLKDSAITGSSAGSGGAIYAYDASATHNITLTLDGTTLASNHATGVGGAVYLYCNASCPGGGAALYLSDSTVAGNTAGTNGGGIRSAGSRALEVGSSTISGNTAAADGGGIDSFHDANPVIRSSTFAGNHATTGLGGGVSADGSGSLDVYDSTFAGNSAGVSGGGIRAANSTPTLLERTIAAGNTAPTSGPDIFASSPNTMNSAFSLIQSPGTFNNEVVGGSDVIGQDPQLGTLQNNGGPTETMKPATTSPAVDKGGIHTLLSESVFDQRGLERPFDVPSVSNSTAAGFDASDIGAVELQAADFQAATPPPTQSAPAPSAPTTAKKCKKKKSSARAAKKCKKKK